MSLGLPNFLLGLNAQTARNEAEEPATTGEDAPPRREKAVLPFDFDAVLNGAEPPAAPEPAGTAAMLQAPALPAAPLPATTPPALPAAVQTPLIPAAPGPAALAAEQAGLIPPPAIRDGLPGRIVLSSPAAARADAAAPAPAIPDIPAARPEVAGLPARSEPAGLPAAANPQLAGMPVPRPNAPFTADPAQTPDMPAPARGFEPRAALPAFPAPPAMPDTPAARPEIATPPARPEPAVSAPAPAIAAAAQISAPQPDIRTGRDAARPAEIPAPARNPETRPAPPSLSAPPANPAMVAASAAPVSAPFPAAAIDDPGREETGAGSVERSAEIGPHAATAQDPVAARLEGPAAPLRGPAATPLAQSLARQLGAAIEKSGDGVIELKLDPPELGRVRLALSGGEHQLTAVISAERPETLDLMRRHADLLQRELQAAGYDGAELRFAGREDRRREGWQGARTPGPDPLPEEVESATASRPAPRSGADGLDLRL